MYVEQLGRYEYIYILYIYDNVIIYIHIIHTYNQLINLYTSGVNGMTRRPRNFAPAHLPAAVHPSAPSLGALRDENASEMSRDADSENIWNYTYDSVYICIYVYIHVFM